MLCDNYGCFCFDCKVYSIEYCFKIVLDLFKICCGDFENYFGD